MKVLITGGAGFVGSHLTEYYLKKGDSVYIIDDLSTGSINNIQHLLDDENLKGRIHFTEETILNYEVMLELIGICDLVVHLAAAVGVKYIIENLLSSIVTNIKGTEVVLELCHKFKKKVLIASTSEVYGKHTHAPLLETDDSVFGPSTKFRWGYAATKLMDEFTALAYYRTNDLPVIIFRLFNTVGPRQTGMYGMVLPTLVRQALAGEPITVYGDGLQTRTFTHVLDVVDNIGKLVETPDAYGEVINIGGIEEVSIKLLAEKIKEKTKSSSILKFIPYETAYPKDFEDMQRRVPSTEKLKRLVGSSPTRNLNQILDDVIQSQKQLSI
jgi:UDP-glucose 4-epimerase